MSAAPQRGIVTRQDELQVLRMFVSGDAQHAIVQATGFSRGTVSKLINGIYPFVPSAGEPTCELAQLRDAVTRRLLLNSLLKVRQGADQLIVTLGGAA
jgi:hypothetical protein